MQSEQAIWSVSALNFEIRTLLEKGIGSIWIEGEISNLARPASGHWYFSIKDERAQLRAAMFKNRNRQVSFKPENGQHVLLRAQVTLYEARGDFQIIIDHMEEAGIGLLMRQYEALKKKLQQEGLFDNAHKKAIPAEAKHIGIVTSASGAAIRDALSVIERRSPSSQVTVFPTPVQGEQATPQIIKAVESANRYGQCDVILLIRGGGSLEDLWCFNDERLARALFDSKCPVVTGIGHEIDFTIADLVADMRAPTPSVAAETVTMDQYEIMSRLDLLTTRLVRLCQNKVQARSQQLEASLNRLKMYHPERQMQALDQRRLFAESRLLSIQAGIFQRFEGRMQLEVEKIKRQNPQLNITAASRQLQALIHQLSLNMHTSLEHKKHAFHLQGRSLDNFSPLKTLDRGYAAVSKGGQLVHSVCQLQNNDEIEIRLKDGQKQAKIL